MASGAPKKVLTVAMTLGLMASVLTTVPVAPAVAQDDDRAASELSGITPVSLEDGDAVDDLSLVHHRQNYNPRIQKGHIKRVPHKHYPRRPNVELKDRVDVVGQTVDINLLQIFRGYNVSQICVYGLPPGVTLDRHGRLTGRLTREGSYNVSIVIKDGYYSHQFDFSWLVHPRNSAPTVNPQSVSFTATGKAGTVGYVPLNVSDDQDIRTLNVKVHNAPAGSRLVWRESNWFLEVPTTNGYQANNIHVTVTDICYLSAEARFNVQVNVVKKNTAPVVSFIPIAQQATGHKGTKATAVVNITDDGLPAGGQISVRPAQPLPAGWVLGGGGNQWTITVPSDKPIPLTGVELIVSDGELSTRVKVGICIWEKPATPSYAPIGLVQAVETVEGKPVRQPIFVYDADTQIQNLNVTVVGDNPSGVRPERQADGTWVLVVPATKATNGAVITELKVTDNTGLSSTFPAVVTVEKNIPAVIGNIGNQSHWVGTNISIDVPVDRHYFQQVEVAGLPSGLRYDPATGKIVGQTTAPTPGAQQVTISLIVKGQRVTKSFTWNVIQIGERTNRIGDRVDWDVTPQLPAGVNPGQVVVTGLPSGLKYANGRITGVITGSVTTYTVKFVVTNTIHTTTFGWKVVEKANTAVPVGQVSSIITRVGAPEQVRPITLTDADTPVDQLKVTIKSGPEGVSVRKGAKGWELVAKTNKVINPTDVVLVVTDGKHSSEFRTTVVVSAAAKITGLGNQTIYLGDSINTITIGITGEQPGDTIEVRLPKDSGLTYNPSTRQITGTPGKKGSYEITVVIRDGSGKILDTQTCVITVVDRPITDATTPTGAVADVSATVGDGDVKRTFSIAYGSKDVSKVKVAIQGSAPEGVKVVREGNQWVLVVSTTKVIKRTQITYVVTDTVSGKSSTVTNWVEVKAKNNAPVVGAVNVTVRNNVEHRVAVPVSDPDGDKIASLVIVNNANGITLNRKADGSYELVIPKGIAPNTYNVELRATDVRGASGSGKAVVKVTENGAPTINSESASISQEDLKKKGFTFQVKASDPDKDPLTLSKLGAWPAGIELDAKTGVINYSKDLAPGSYTVSVNVSDGQASAAGTFTLVVKAPAAPTAPSIDKIGDQNNIVGDSVNVKVTVHNAKHTDVRVFGLPPGLTYDAAKGAIVGKVTTKGVYSVGVLVVTAGGVAETRFTWTVKEPQTTVPSKVGDLDNRQDRVNLPIKAYNLHADLKAKVKGQVDLIEVFGLPQGLTYNPGTGLITGTPTVEAQGVNVTVKVTNKGGSLLLPFVWTIFGQPTIKIPNQVTDVNTKVTLDIKPFITDGRPNQAIDWTKVTIKGLPEGLKYNPDGTITGTTSATPSAPKEVTVNVITTDQVSVTNTFTWEVKAPAQTATPMGQVDAIIARVGDAAKTARVKLSDFDTPAEKLVVEKVGAWPAGVELVKVSEGVYDVVVKTDKVIPATPITLKVTDGVNASQFKGFVEVKPEADIVDIADQTVTLGNKITPIKVSVLHELPGDVITATSSDPGIKWDAASRTFTGAPTKMGKVVISVTIATADGRKMDEETATINVVCDPNVGPTVSVSELVGEKGKPFTPVTLNVSDDTTPIKDLKVVVESKAPVEAKFDGTKWVLVLNTDNKLDPTPVKVTVTDKDGLSSSTTTWAMVKTTKSKARLIPIGDQVGEVKKPIKPIKVEAIDLQPGDKIVVEGLPSGITFDPKTNTISGTPTEVKKSPVTVTIVDDSGNVVDRDTFTIDIKAPLAPPANTKPVVFAPDMLFPEGQKREVGIKVTDEDPKTVKVSIVGDTPGITVRQDDKGGWVLVADGTKPLDTKVTLVGVDKEGLKSDPYVVSVKTFRAQVSDLDPLGKQTVDVGTPIKPVTVKINNEQPGDKLEIVGLPTWAKFDEKTKTFSGTPDVDGVYTITVILKSAAGVLQDTEVLTIEAVKVAEVDIDVPDAETIVNTPLPPVKVTVKNADLKDVTFDKPLPEGLKYNPATGLIEGTPTKVGVYEIKATVKGVKGRTDTDEFKITVKEAPITNTKAPTGMVNPVMAYVGDPTVKREIFVTDADTEYDKLVVTLVKGPEGVSVVKEGKRWFLVVKTDKVVPTTPVTLKVSDGKLENTFSTSVTVSEKPQTKIPTPSIDNPGGQTSEVGKPIDPLDVNTKDVPKGETPKVDGLPEGLKPNFNPSTGVITITGTPTKPTDKPVEVTITVTNPNDPTKPIQEKFPWQVNPKDGNKLGPKGWVDPVVAKVGDPMVKKPIHLSDADTPLKDLVVTMTSAPEGVKLTKNPDGTYSMDVSTDKVIPNTKVTFQVTDGKHITLFETTVMVGDKAEQPKAPTGVVNPVIAFVGDPTVEREIFVFDADTDLDKLKVELVSGPDVASLKQDGKRWFLVVTPTKKVDTQQVTFKVSDGQHATQFSTTVTVKEKPKTTIPTPSVDNPGGQTSTEGKPIDPVKVNTKDVPKGETPKVDGLPEGLKENFDPSTGVITITGTPTKPTDKPVEVTITVTNPNDPTKPIQEKFPWQVNPKDGDKFAPKGWVDPVIAKVDDPEQKRPVNLSDADTPVKDLVVTMTSAPVGVKLVKGDDGYVMVVATAKDIPTTKVTFQVTDGKHISLFETTVTVVRGTDDTGNPALKVEVPDGKTVVNTPLPPLSVTIEGTDKRDVTFDKPLPAGLKYNPETKKIEGTPTVVGVTKLTATITDKDGNKASDDFTITVTEPSKTPAPGPVPDPPTGIGSILDGTRLQGPTRIETAIAISRRWNKDQSVQSVVIARNDQYADANAATPFADQESAPILLSTSDTLHPETAKEIKRILKPGGKIFMMGREVALTNKVEAELKAQFQGHEVTRIGGANRFETAALIYNQLGSPSLVTVVDGDNKFVGDALVAGTAMAYKNGAVLYTSLGKIAPETLPVLNNGKVTTKYSYDPQTQVPGAVLMGGQNIVQRSVLTAKTFFGSSFTEVGIASANEANVVDALTGGAMAARRKAPMLLTSTDPADATIRTFINEKVKDKTLQHAWIFGGIQAIPQNIVDALGGEGVKMNVVTFNWTDVTPANPEDLQASHKPTDKPKGK